MSSQYKLVLISVLSTLLLLAVLTVLKYLFPNRKIPKISLLVLVSLLPLVSMLRPGSYESGDLSIHSTFTMIFFRSLKEGIFLPIWHSYAVGGYGYPYFLFVYPLPYYLSSLIHLLGFSFIDSAKILAAVFYLISGPAVYFWIKEETKKPLAGFIAGIFYLFAPYHLLDLHFRFAIGEVLAFSFLPSSFYSLKKIENKEYKEIFLLSVFFGGLILSHQAIAFVAAFLLTAYSLFFSKNLDLLFRRFLGLLGGVLITSFFWFPLLLDSKYTHLLNWKIYFYPLQDFIFSPSRFGLLYQGHMGELYFPIGYIHLPILVTSVLVFLLVKYRKKYIGKENLKLYLFSLISFGICFFLMQSISSKIWGIAPLLKGFQFSYRLSMFCALFSSVIAAIVLSRLKSKLFVYAVLSVVVMITILNWGNRRNLPLVNDRVLSQGFYQSAKTQGQGTTIWTDADKLVDRKENVSVVKGIARVKELDRTSIQHEYLIEVRSDTAEFIDNTLYFPGWNLIVNDEIRYLDPTIANGLISFSLNKGFYIIDLKFLPAKEIFVSRLLSVVSLIALCLPLIFVKIKKR